MDQGNLDNTTLFQSQKDQIFGSRLLQNDDSGYFLDVNPILVAASLDEPTPSVEVPEPSSWLLMLAGLFVLVSCRRRVVPTDA